MFFDQWSDIVRIIIVGAIAYAALVFLLRITGKRTLSKMNVFDFVVTIALGSTLATILLSTETSLADGVVALLVLIVLQWAVAWMSTRFGWFLDVIKARPRLLFLDGRMLHTALLDERVSPEEVLAAVRGSGRASLDDVHAVVLETDGSFSVLGKSDTGDDGALENVVST